MTENNEKLHWLSIILKISQVSFYRWIGSFNHSVGNGGLNHLNFSNFFGDSQGQYLLSDNLLTQFLSLIFIIENIQQIFDAL